MIAENGNVKLVECLLCPSSRFGLDRLDKLFMWREGDGGKKGSKDPKAQQQNVYSDLMI
jgi:hypothetical protein